MVDSGEVKVLTLGDKVEGVSLQVFVNNDIKDISLDDLMNEGKWVILFFYPADFTYVCPTELEDLVSVYGELKDLGAELISVSTDTVYAHKAWKESSPSVSKVEYPMGADPSGKISRMFGVYNEETGLAKRGTFVIDPDGVIRVVEMHDDSVGRSAKELVRRIKALKFVKESGGKVCPASWEPGDDGLSPTIDMAGKI